MNKLKMFCMAAALVLVTAGVFAGKARFASGQIFATDFTTYVPVSSASVTTAGSFSTTGNATTQVTIGNASGTLPMYILVGATYERLYSTATF